MGKISNTKKNAQAINSTANGRNKFKKNKKDINKRKEKQNTKDVDKIRTSEKDHHHELNQNKILLTKQQKRDLKRNAKALSSSTTTTSIPRSYEYTSSQSNNNKNSSVYKRITVYPSASSLTCSINNRFITPSDNEIFHELVKTSYRGFVAEPPQTFPDEFHNKVICLF